MRVLVARGSELEREFAHGVVRQLFEPLFARTALRTGTISFVHPLVRAAVYEGLAETVRLPGHARAARLLADRGHAPERAAAHLLIIPPAGDGFVVDTLRRAADQAFARGSPDGAVSYLERCLQEPPPQEQCSTPAVVGKPAKSCRGQPSP